MLLHSFLELFDKGNLQRSKRKLIYFVAKIFKHFGIASVFSLRLEIAGVGEPEDK